MAYTIIDRTLNGKRTSGSRQKFVRRVKREIRDQVNKHITGGSIDDLVTNKGRKINIPKKDLQQPTFQHGKGGHREIVHPGNKKYVQGDRIDKKKDGQGQGGRKGSKDGEGQDSFTFTLTQEEFLDIFFEDCELPNLEETVIAQTDAYEIKRAGFSTEGSTAQLNIPRTMRQSKGRRIGLLRKVKKNKVRELEQQERVLLELLESAQANGHDTHSLKDELDKIRTLLQVHRRKLRSIPFVDDTDLRYNKWDTVPIPTYQAVMINIMDVSASMGEWEKEMAKRFFMMMYLFLSKNHERVEVVWIRHHTRASEETEEEFFRSRETGGTQVSTAYALANNIISERYPVTQWNIYGCQASDGDNWSDDTPVAIDILTKNLLPVMRYFAYIETVQDTNYESDLWPKYEEITKSWQNFQMRHVTDAADIYPVFHELFKKKSR